MADHRYDCRSQGRALFIDDSVQSELCIEACSRLEKIGCLNCQSDSHEASDCKLPIRKGLNVGRLRKFVIMMVSCNPIPQAQHYLPYDVPLRGVVLDINEEEKCIYVRPQIYDELDRMLASSLEELRTVEISPVYSRTINIGDVYLIRRNKSDVLARAVCGCMNYTFQNAVRWQMYLIDYGQLEFIEEHQVFPLPFHLCHYPPMALPLIIASCRCGQKISTIYGDEHFKTFRKYSPCVFALASSIDGRTFCYGTEQFYPNVIRKVYPPRLLARIFSGYTIHNEILCVKSHSFRSADCCPFYSPSAYSYPPFTVITSLPYTLGVQMTEKIDENTYWFRVSAISSIIEKEIRMPLNGLWSSILGNGVLSCITYVQRPMQKEPKYYRALAWGIDMNRGQCSAYLIDYGQTVSCEVHKLFDLTGQPTSIMHWCGAAFKCRLENVNIDEQNPSRLAIDEKYIITVSGMVEGGIYTGRIEFLPQKYSMSHLNGPKMTSSYSNARVPTGFDEITETDTCEGSSFVNSSVFEERLANRFESTLQIIMKELNQKMEQLTDHFESAINALKSNVTPQQPAFSSYLTNVTRDPRFHIPLAQYPSDTLYYPQHLMPNVQPPRYISDPSIPSAHYLQQTPNSMTRDVFFHHNKPPPYCTASTADSSLQDVINCSRMVNEIRSTRRLSKSSNLQFFSRRNDKVTLRTAQRHASPFSLDQMSQGTLCFDSRNDGTPFSMGPNDLVKSPRIYVNSKKKFILKNTSHRPSSEHHMAKEQESSDDETADVPMGCQTPAKITETTSQRPVSNDKITGETKMIGVNADLKTDKIEKCAEGPSQDCDKHENSCWICGKMDMTQYCQATPPAFWRVSEKKEVEKGKNERRKDDNKPRDAKGRVLYTSDESSEDEHDDDSNEYESSKEVINPNQDIDQNIGDLESITVLDYKLHVSYLLVQFGSQYMVTRCDDDELSAPSWPLFFVHFVAVQYQQALESFRQTLNTATTIASEEATVGKMCVAYSRQQNHPVRATVTSLQSKKARIFHLDYGNYEWVSRTSLSPMEIQNQGSRTLPGLAVPCVLENFIDASTIKHLDGHETERLKNEIGKRGNTMCLLFTRCIDGVCIVQLIK